MTDTSRTSHEDDDMRAELARLREVTKGAYWVVETAPHARIRGSGARWMSVLLSTLILDAGTATRGWVFEP